MATAGQSSVLAGLANKPASFDEKGQSTDRKAGPVLLLSGTAYAAAYVVVGITGMSSWGALLAIAGTGLVLLGLKFVVLRAS